MIIYNSNKEFIGIDESDLKSLGFNNLASLQAEAADFADLLVKTPGHVHNFEHVHWIDFVSYAKSIEDSKAIIHANNKNFKVNLEVKTIYLSNAPSTQAYMVVLNNLRLLSGDEKVEIAQELENRVTPSPAVSIPQPITKLIEDDYDTYQEPTEVPKNEPYEKENIIEDPYAIIDETEDETEEETDDNYIQDIYEPTTEELENIGDPQVHDDDIYENSVNDSELMSQVEEADENAFVFDPQKTAEVLEMPISLIEEFIEDFINQSINFKDPLYEAVEKDDMIKLQSYSHQLKGVAANLRVDDALEVLNKINKAKDFTTSKKDLDAFYKIISKLSGEEIQTQSTSDTLAPQSKFQEEEPQKIDLSEDDELEEIEIEIADDDDNDDNMLIIDDDLDMIKDDDLEAIEIADDELNELIEEENVEDSKTTYNKQTIANEIGVDEESFNELFSDYISESQAIISTIEEAILNNDIDTRKKSAIQLKGMSDNMRINDFITDLEILIATDDSSDAKNALKQIQASIFKILEAKD